MAGSLRFVGGTIDGDEGDPRWDALALGPGYSKRWSAWIASTLRESRAGGIGPGRKRTFAYHPSARGRIDLGDVDLEGDDSIPPYRGLER